MTKKLFRKEALERLESPDQLDAVVRITRPGHWLALGTCFAIILAVLAWSILGSIPQRVSGQGLLIRHGGVYSVTTDSSGQIVDILPEVGDVVEAGDVVARLSRPLEAQRLDDTRTRYQEAITYFKTLEAFYAKGNDIRAENLSQKRLQLEARVEAGRQKEAYLAKLLEVMKDLREENVVSAVELHQTRMDLYDARDNIQQSLSELAEMTSQHHDVTTSAERELLEQSHRAANALRESLVKEREVAVGSVIRSPFGGRVVEISTRVGQIQNAGEPIMRLEPVDEPLEVLVFVDSGDGKKIDLEMNMDVTPSIYNAQEYGGMMGVVSQVTQYPLSDESMIQTLGGNAALAKTLAASNYRVLVTGSLLPDAETVSGYRWTTSDGPGGRIESGTLCAVTIIVDRKRPISLLIPYLKEKLGV